MLYEEDVIYRPPMEADSVLLEVCSGCTYGKCSFCVCSAGGRRFHRIPVERIRENAQVLGIIEWQKEKAFLLGENAFVLKSSYLEEIFDIIHQHLPRVKHISLFSRTDDVDRKSDQELLDLKARGLGDLYIGVESGREEILKRFRKGVTAARMLDTFRRLDRLGLTYSVSAIFGLGGRDGWRDHARETAALLSQTRPRTIRMMSLNPWEGTPLYREIQEGRFRELSPGGLLLEQRLFLENLKVTDCLFVGNHVSNNVPLIGLLPDHREKLLEMLDKVISAVDLEKLEKSSFNQW